MDTMVNSRSVDVDVCLIVYDDSRLVQHWTAKKQLVLLDLNQLCYNSYGMEYLENFFRRNFASYIEV